VTDTLTETVALANSLIEDASMIETLTETVPLRDPDRDCPCGGYPEKDMTETLTETVTRTLMVTLID